MKRLDSPDVRTLTAFTGNGKHYYFTSKTQIRNSSGLLGEGIDVRGVGGYVVGVGSRHVHGTHYKWEDPSQPVKPLPQQILQRLAVPQNNLVDEEKHNSIVRGERNSTLTSFAGVMRRPGMSYRSIKSALIAENHYRCKPPLPDDEVKIIASSVARYTPASPIGNWPESLADAALYGIFREIVDTFTSRSEVDPVGLLVHALAFAGSAIGSSAHIRVASDRHHMNIFAVTVGETAKARKMSAFNHVHQLFRIAVPAWVHDSLETGLSSGEGVIHSVRQRAGAQITSDPTLLVFEPEFGSVLRVMQRQGNTLSPVLRQAWDGTALGVLTRRDPLKAPVSHISLIGHITRLELTDLITRRDIFGGLANRILWVCVRRHAVRSDLGGIPDALLRVLAQKVKSAVHEAENIGKLTFSAEAQRKWDEIYPGLSLDQPGLLGAVTSRAEAQVLRLAGIYALMSEQRHVQEAHLEAALAVWRHCQQSAAVIFGSKQDESLEGKILKLLVNAAGGLTRTDISEAFHNHKSTSEISGALQLLEGKGHVRRVVGRTAGRSAEVWLATIQKGQS
jgi:hypothetical protein